MFTSAPRSKRYSTCRGRGKGEKAHTSGHSISASLELHSGYLTLSYPHTPPTHSTHTLHSHPLTPLTHLTLTLHSHSTHTPHSHSTHTPHSHPTHTPHSHPTHTPPTHPTHTPPTHPTLTLHSHPTHTPHSHSTHTPHSHTPLTPHPHTPPTISAGPNADAQFNRVCPMSSMKFTSNPEPEIRTCPWYTCAHQPWDTKPHNTTCLTQMCARTYVQ